MQPHFSARSLRDLRKLDSRIRTHVVRGIERYAATGIGDVNRVKAQSRGQLRLRVGDWRVFFTKPDQGIIEINSILHRRNAYR